MEDVCNELIKFMKLSTRLELKLTATKNVLSLTGSSEGRKFITDNDALLEVRRCADFWPTRLLMACWTVEIADMLESFSSIYLKELIDTICYYYVGCYTVQITSIVKLEYLVIYRLRFGQQGLTYYSAAGTILAYTLYKRQCLFCRLQRNTDWLASVRMTVV